MMKDVLIAAAIVGACLLVGVAAVTEIDRLVRDRAPPVTNCADADACWRESLPKCADDEAATLLPHNHWQCAKIPKVLWPPPTAEWMPPLPHIITGITNDGVPLEPIRRGSCEPDEIGVLLDVHPDDPRYSEWQCAKISAIRAPH